MSEYDDDTPRLSDRCDNCGRTFFECDCDMDETIPEVTIEDDEDERPENPAAR